jgi:hypothetical protein
VTDDRRGLHELALIQKIDQNVERILRQQELSQVLVREVADRRMTALFGEAKLDNILVFLHATDMNQTTMAGALNKRYGKFRVNLSQPRISIILRELREAGFLRPSNPPEYAPGWGPFELHAYLRRQLPPQLRSPLKSHLDRVRKST